MAHAFVRHVNRTFQALGAAVRAADAVDNRRNPRREDLVTLGIDPDAFRKIPL